MVVISVYLNVFNFYYLQESKEKTNKPCIIEMFILDNERDDGNLHKKII